jgi:spore coat polysaccharide biosynthesis protein SpsF
MTLIIIQARMGSKRLPGKVMMKINGKPMLYYIIRQIRNSKFNPEIIVATSNLPKDDIIEEYVKSQNVRIFRGSENDVLDRYYQCAKTSSNEPIIRICADSPFIDPQIIDQSIEKFMSVKPDYLSNIIEKDKDVWIEGSCGFPIGTAVEVFSFSALEKTWNNSIDPYEREHVTEYIIKHSKDFKLDNIKNSINLSKYRIVVDHLYDFELASKIILKFSEDEIFNISKVIAILKKFSENKN